MFKTKTKIHRATLPLTTDTKELPDCMCPHLSNLNHNNGSDMNAPNVVTDLSNISHQGYESDHVRFDMSPITTTNNSHSNSNRNGDVINSMTTVATTTPATVITTTAASTTQTTTTATGTSPTDDDSRLRHSSMDRLMSLLNDLGNTTRTRSLSDGGQEEGEFDLFRFKSDLFEWHCLELR